MFLRPYARQHEQLRSVHRACGQDHLPSREYDPPPPVLGKKNRMSKSKVEKNRTDVPYDQHVHARRPLVQRSHFRHGRVHYHVEVTSVLERRDERSRAAQTHAVPAYRLRHRETVYPIPRQVLRNAETRLLRRFQDLPSERWLVWEPVQHFLLLKIIVYNCC